MSLDDNGSTQQHEIVPGISQHACRRSAPPAAHHRYVNGGVEISRSGKMGWPIPWRKVLLDGPNRASASQPLTISLKEDDDEDAKGM